MTKDEVTELYKDVPEIIESTILMTEANSVIKIFEGDYILKSDKEEISITGTIFFNWVASSGAHFSGIIRSESSHLHTFSTEHTEYKIIIDGLEFGEGLINSTTFGSDSSGTLIKGKIVGQAVLGDKSIAVEKLKFSIPNLRDFFGTPVKSKTDKVFLFHQTD